VWLREGLEHRKWDRIERSQRAALGDAYRRHRTLTEDERRAIVASVAGFLELASQHGVRALLVVPAHRTSEAQLGLFYGSWPRVDVSWLESARRGVEPDLRRLAAGSGARVFDLAEGIAGHEDEWMVDFYHFSDTGAERVGELVADELAALLGSKGVGAAGR
jgi:lysophospholipase L1-like esterase